MERGMNQLIIDRLSHGVADRIETQTISTTRGNKMSSLSSQRLIPISGEQSTPGKIQDLELTQELQTQETLELCQEMIGQRAQPCQDQNLVQDRYPSRLKIEHIQSNRSISHLELRISQLPN